MDTFIPNLGALCFGLVIGWVTYRTLRRREGAAVLSDIATVVAAVGGASITTLFDSKTLFGWYAIGLAAGFFGYLIIAIRTSDAADTYRKWMGE